MVVTDSLVVIQDDTGPGGPSIIKDAASVVKRVHNGVASLDARRLFYKDLMGRFDEICHRAGAFTGVSACSEPQRAVLNNLTR